MRPSQQSAFFSDTDNVLTRRIKYFSLVLIICWTLFICFSWYWNYQAERKVFNKVALAEARTVVERDALYRRWSSNHGGVYVPNTAKSPPNTHLSHIPERDILTPSGKQLTLINPAYMTRQVNDLAKESAVYLGRAHLTSLNPLRPENKPDKWETDALRSFENGTVEASAVTTIDGKPYMRLMTPFITEASCLKCHFSQGYTVGSIRGGISVSIPIQPLLDASRGQIVGSLAFHGMIWLLGLGVTGLGARQLSQSARVQKKIAEDLRQRTLQLEDEIAERRKAQESLQESESHLRIVADYSSNWEYWRLPDNRFVYMSPSAKTVTGFSIEEFVADSELIYTIIHPDDRELFRDHTHQTDSHGQIMPIEMRIVCKDGEVHWISHVCQQVFTSGGVPWGWRASNQDITERKTAQTELICLNHSLEERIKQTVADLRHKDQSLIQQGRLAAIDEQYC